MSVHETRWGAGADEDSAAGLVSPQERREVPGAAEQHARRGLVGAGGGRVRADADGADAGTASARGTRGDGREDAHPARRRHYVPLLGRILIANGVLLLTSFVAIFIVLSPRRVSELATDEILVAALSVITLVNVLLVRRIAIPFQQLTAVARRVDPDRPGERMPGAGPGSETGELALAFNEMLERLERERAESARRVLAAHEAERLRVAQELHDEVGQTLTAVLLQLSRLRDHVRDEIRPELEEAQEAARSSLADVRRIATDLRPETLTDLGLPSALATLGANFAQRTGIRVRQHIDQRIRPLSSDAELAIYRVAQEALTNVARHSGSDRAELALADGANRLRLTVRDYGTLSDGGERIDGSGIRGMRERARLVGGRLTIGAPPHGPGHLVALEVPHRRSP